VLYAAIDIHKHAFQAAVFDAETGEVTEDRFSADRESLGRWAERWCGRVEVVAIEATTGWRWVWRVLAERGFEVRLAEPVQARGLLGRRCSAEDRPAGRALAVAVVGKGDAAGVVDPAGGGSAAA
jgi:transposase